MSKRVYIIHGWDGSPYGDWIPWAVQMCEKMGYTVNALTMPHPDSPQIGEWVEYLKETVIDPDHETYFIGHSIGCQAILRYFETTSIQVGGSVFVAGWFNLKNLENPEAESIARPWIETPIDFDKVKKVLNTLVVILGDNDQWVPYEETKKAFETQLGAKVITLHGAGHITSDDGFGPIPQLIDALREIDSR